MVSGCMNPDCRREFRLLGGGDLYAHEGSGTATEFFWLCADCARSLEAYLDTEGGVKVRARGCAGSALLPRAAGHLRIVAGSALRMPWRHSVPAGEQHSYWMCGERREGNGPVRRGWG